MRFDFWFQEKLWIRSKQKLLFKFWPFCLQPCKLIAIKSIPLLFGLRLQSCDRLSGDFSVQSGHGLHSDHRQTNSIELSRNSSRDLKRMQFLIQVLWIP